MIGYARGWVVQDDVDDGTKGGAGGGTVVVDDNTVVDKTVEGETGEEDDAATAAAAAAAAAAPPKKEEGPKDMKSAIDLALGYDKDAKAKADAATAAAAETKKAEELAAQVKAAGAHANGKPKKNEKGEDLDQDGKVLPKLAPKPKTAAELDLKPEERKLLGAKTQQRFGEMITTLKAHEGTIAKQGEQITRLSGARDAILGALEDSRTTQEDLGQYLEFNSLRTSRDPKDWETALQMIEAQRLEIYKALGREPEGGGIDLLSEHHDLAKQVEDAEITRAAALEIAQGRRERAQRAAGADQQRQQQQAKQQSANEFKAKSDKALADIKAWTGGLATSDLDYKAKEDKLLVELDGVLKEYPPELWLPTLKRLYGGITVEKAAAPANKQMQPLRPSGAKPGAKTATTMLEAINQGLGYAGADKG